jgi:adenine deaminase
VQSILEAATIDGARVMGLGNNVGSLTPGKQADLIMIRTDGIAMFPSHNAVGNVVHMANRSDVRTVMVAGRLPSMKVNWLISTWKASEAQQGPRANICSMLPATSRTRSKMHSRICNRLPYPRNAQAGALEWITSSLHRAMRQCHCH